MRDRDPLAAGIPSAIQTGFEGYVPKTHVRPWEGAIPTVNGLGRERALETATLGVARVLGVDDRVGSIESARMPISSSATASRSSTPVTCAA